MISWLWLFVALGVGMYLGADLQESGYFNNEDYDPPV